MPVEHQATVPPSGHIVEQILVWKLLNCVHFLLNWAHGFILNFLSNVGHMFIVTPANESND